MKKNTVQTDRQSFLAELTQLTIYKTKHQTKDKVDKSNTKTSTGKQKIVPETTDYTSDTPSGEDTMSLDLSPRSNPRPEPESTNLQATLVAQEVSKMLMPLYDKRLEILHTSINSALTQITSNAQRITEVENRLQETEQTVATLSFQQSQTLKEELHNKIN